MTKLNTITQTIIYYLSDHPIIINFRWSPTQTWFSSWSFLISILCLYIFVAIILNLAITLLPHYPTWRSPLTLHSLLISLISATIFLGTAISATAEINHNSRWLWRSTHLRTTPARWLLCFPPDTRPSGRVFFWSYAFYLSRLFLHLPRTLLKSLLRRRCMSVTLLLNQCSLLVMSFLWLEFTQSFQVVATLMLSLLYAVVYGYRFWAGIGLKRARFPFVVKCQIVLVSCNFACHVGVLVLHFVSYNKGGCNGIGAWGFNSVCNGLILMMNLKDFKKRIKRNGFDDDSSTRHPRSRLDKQR